MLIARIERPIWSTRKAENLDGVRLLEARIVRNGNIDSPEFGGTMVVADNIGAGIGEYVFLCTGSAVRNVVFGEKAPFKTVVTAILDQVSLQQTDGKDQNEFTLMAEN